MHKHIATVEYTPFLLLFLSLFLFFSFNFLVPFVQLISKKSNGEEKKDMQFSLASSSNNNVRRTYDSLLYGCAVHGNIVQSRKEKYRIHETKPTQTNHENCISKNYDKFAQTEKPKWNS